ncbi:MAG: efflux RND transporter permease subunit, partial [Thermoguttaceae bacterium]
MTESTTRPAPVLFFRRFGPVLLVVTALLLPLIAWGSLLALRSNRNDVKSWLPSAYEETKTFVWYWTHFPGDAFILASWDGCTLGNPQVAEVATTLREAKVNSGSGDKPLFQRVTTGEDLLSGLVDGQKVSPETALDRLRGSLIGRDGKQTCVILQLNTEEIRNREVAKTVGKNSSAKMFHEAVEKVYVAGEQAGIPRASMHLGGPPVDNVAIDIEGERSLMKLAAICGILGLVLSWWSLRSIKLTAIVCSTALFSAGISLALVWFSGATMNAILMTMPALVFVAGISGAIHLANYYGDAVRNGGIPGAADRAISHAWLPLALATGTTGIGLASLAASELSPIKMFGIYSCLGIVGGFVLLCLYTPSLLELTRPVPARKAAENETSAHAATPWWDSAALWIIRRNWLVTVLFFATIALGAYGMTRVKTSVQLMRLFSPEAQILQDYRYLEEKLGPLVPVEVVLRVDTRRCSMDILDQMRMVRAVQRSIANVPEVGSAMAAPTFARPMPQRAGALGRAAWNSQLEGNRQRLVDYWSRDGHEELWRISARVSALGDLDYKVFLDNLHEVVDPVLQEYRDQGIEGITPTYTGLIPLVYKAQHSLFDGLILGFSGDLILIGVAMILMMRNFSSGMLLILPSVFPLVLVFGFMGLMGIVVDTGTVMAPAVALGVTVDDAIHFMLWCRKGESMGMNRTQSIMFAYRD